MEKHKAAKKISSLFGFGNLPYASEPRGQQIKLGAVGAAGLRLQMAHACKLALEAGEQLALRAALQHLGQEESARHQDFAGEIGGEFDQADDAQLVGLPMTGGVGGHIGQHAVGEAAQPLTKLMRGLAIVEV